MQDHLSACPLSFWFCHFDALLSLLPCPSWLWGVWLLLHPSLEDKFTSWASTTPTCGRRGFSFTVGRKEASPFTVRTALTLSSLHRADCIQGRVHYVYFCWWTTVSFQGSLKAATVFFFFFFFFLRFKAPPPLSIWVYCFRSFLMLTIVF